MVSTRASSLRRHFRIDERAQASFLEISRELGEQTQIAIVEKVRKSSIP